MKVWVSVSEKYPFDLGAVTLVQLREEFPTEVSIQLWGIIIASQWAKSVEIQIPDNVVIISNPSHIFVWNLVFLSVPIRSKIRNLSDVVLFWYVAGKVKPLDSLLKNDMTCYVQLDPFPEMLPITSFTADMLEQKKKKTLGFPHSDKSIFLLLTPAPANVHQYTHVYTLFHMFWKLLWTEALLDSMEQLLTQSGVHRGYLHDGYELSWREKLA